MTQRMVPTGDRVREARQRAGLTQEQLAARAGVRAMRISRCERGLTVRPHRDLLTRLADALGVEPAELA